MLSLITNSSLKLSQEFSWIPQRLELCGYYSPNKVIAFNSKSAESGSQFLFPSMLSLLESSDGLQYFPQKDVEIFPLPVVVVYSIRASFNFYYAEWNRETKYLSSIDTITNNRFFKKIINLGTDIVPHIVEILRETPSFLFVALYKITGENPVEVSHHGKIKEMTNDWIKWWDKKHSTLD